MLKSEIETFYRQTKKEEQEEQEEQGWLLFWGILEEEIMPEKRDRRL